MNAKTLFTLMAFLLLQQVYPQKAAPLNYFSFSIAPSIPLGKFASNNFTDPAAGYAKIGESVSIGFEHKLGGILGLKAMLYGQRNGVDVNKLAGQLDQTPINWGANVGHGYYSNWQLNKRSWYVESALIGLTASLPQAGSSGRITLNLQALAGAAYVEMPSLKGSSISDTSYTTISQGSGSALGFAYLLGIGLKYRCSTNLFLLAAVDYFGTSKISFSNISESIYSTYGGLNVPHVYSLSNSVGPLVGLASSNSVKQPVGTININFGVAWYW
jgi:hypothetical protein